MSKHMPDVQVSKQFIYGMTKLKDENLLVYGYKFAVIVKLW